MNDTRGAMPEGLEIHCLTPADVAAAEEIARVGLLAWGQELKPAKLERHAERLGREIARLEAAGHPGFF